MIRIRSVVYAYPSLCMKLLNDERVTFDSAEHGDRILSGHTNAHRLLITFLVLIGAFWRLTFSTSFICFVCKINLKFNILLFSFVMYVLRSEKNPRFFLRCITIFPAKRSRLRNFRLSNTVLMRSVKC